MSKTPHTELDRLLQGHDGALSPQFFTALLSSQIYLLAQGDPDRAQPQIFDTSDGSLVLGFDLPERLGAFGGGGVAYMVLSGRQLVGILSTQSLGLGLNFEQSDYAITIPADAISWLCRQPLSPLQHSTGIKQLYAPDTATPVLLQALDRQLSLMTGLAEMAYLCRTQGDELLLAIIEPKHGAQEAIKTAIGEAIALLGVKTAPLDIMFLSAHDPICARLVRVGLRFDLPQPAKIPIPQAPGMDPKKPPKLR